MSRVLELICHSDTPASRVNRLWVEMDVASDTMTLRYFVEGVEFLSLSPQLPSARARGLWQTTCFELFLWPVHGEGYFEYNFSPSTQWAVYAFDSYRDGMRDAPCRVAPSVECGVGEAEAFVVQARVDLAEIPAGALRVGISAVIEENDGSKSCWALAHPPGKPDFHDPACFALELPASNRP